MTRWCLAYPDGGCVLRRTFPALFARDMEEKRYNDISVTQQYWKINNDKRFIKMEGSRKILHAHAHLHAEKPFFPPPPETKKVT